MKTNPRILCFIALVLIGQSCGRTLYSPNRINAPLIKEKNEFRATLAPNNIHTAYGISNNIAVMANGQLQSSEQSNELGEDDSSELFFAEAGLGYFSPIRENAVFEVYGGGGLGKLHFDNKDNRGSDEFSTKFSRIFIQPSFGLTHQNFDVSFSLRFAKINFYDADASNYVFTGTSVNDWDLRTIHENSYFFVEPGLTFRLGLKQVKLQLQLQSVKQISGPHIFNYVVPLSFGIHVNFAKRQKGT